VFFAALPLSYPKIVLGRGFGPLPAPYNGSNRHNDCFSDFGGTGENLTQSPIKGTICLANSLGNMPILRSIIKLRL